MSEFDKEAEREKLRQKYERDKEKRESTQRMSELLLKGATMTNKHCDDCGDPIFRWEGQEFCPTCQAAVSAGEEATTGAVTREQAEPQTAEANGQRRSAEADRRQRPSDIDAQQRPAESGGTNRESEPTERGQTPRREPVAPENASSVRPPATEAAATLADARASLIRSVVRFAREAEATDDPRRARDVLAAAHEAADALAALDQ
ncbi:MAG: Sjogren's syndrome/scleroderma autoantigen 1 family protein [Halobacteriota archaeon]